MKITDFKMGDLIVRIKQSNVYSAASVYIGDPFIFLEIKYGKIYYFRFDRHREYRIHPVLWEEELEERKDDIWEYYEAPAILRNAIMGRLYDAMSDADARKDVFKESIFRAAMKELGETNK